MPNMDPRVDAYIAKSPAFAQPILKNIRKQVHAAFPAAEETLKWGVPHFTHKGILCGMAAFKEHCRIMFWKGLGSIGSIKSVADLPPNTVLAARVKKAAALNENGAKRTRPSRPAKAPVTVPAFITAELKKNPRAFAAFKAFSPSHKREYVEWITEAKREETRERRLMTAVEWIASGKSRNWKYER